MCQKYFILIKSIIIIFCSIYPHQNSTLLLYAFNAKHINDYNEKNN